VDPKTRGVNDLVHVVTAAASSSSASRAASFLEEVGAPKDAKAYGSYEELVRDPNIDIVYIATPHSHHFQNMMLCLEAGKNILCEKAFTVNAAQARKVVDLARQKGLFLMEAVWTRYFPLSIYVRETISSGRLGTIVKATADNSVNLDPRNKMADGKHRMVNPDLAGGALLDLGIYSLTWIFQTLYDTQPAGERKPPSVLASITPYEPTGVDETTTMVLTFPRASGGAAHGVATTSLTVASDPDKKSHGGPSVRVQGTKGEIHIFAPIPRPTRTKLVLDDGTVEDRNWEQPGPGAGSGWFNGFGGGLNKEGEGQGMFWEADEAGRALVEGRKESVVQDLENSILIMEVMDEVRRQGNFTLPAPIESTDYPVQL
jgi:dihydrodiol dehydrogenase / D-xylose 1-dehydrogenase (NADP)